MTLSELHREMDRLAAVLAGGERMEWPDLVAAAREEIEDLRACLDRAHDGSRRVIDLPAAVAQWVRETIGMEG
jgi:hypothetical protein